MCTTFRVVGGLILIVKCIEIGYLAIYLHSTSECMERRMERKRIHSTIPPSTSPCSAFCMRARVSIYILLKIYCFPLINMNDKIHSHACMQAKQQPQQKTVKDGRGRPGLYNVYANYARYTIALCAQQKISGKWYAFANYYAKMHILYSYTCVRGWKQCTIKLV